MGWGAVTRDHSGVFKLSCSASIIGITSPELAEALAICNAMQLSLDYGFKEIILASDCLSLLQRIWAREVDRSIVGAVVSDIKTLATGFLACNFKHYGRKNNAAAHILASNSQASVCNISINVASVCIREVLCNDVK